MAQVELYYYDFNSCEMKPLQPGDVATNLQLPIGYVVMNVTGTNPYDELGYGSWNQIGTQTIGGVTVYYYENQAA